MKRFDPWRNADGVPHMKEIPEGDWVRWADHDARTRELEAEVENAKAVAHGRGYQQGKAAGDAFGAAMREHVTRLEAENKALREGRDKLRDALDPDQTKAAYIGEVTDTVEVERYDPEEDDFVLVSIQHVISWTATKKIMSMIRARAALAKPGDGND